MKASGVSLGVSAAARNPRVNFGVSMSKLKERVTTTYM